MKAKIIVDPKEFGLETSKAKQIEKQFTPAIVEREALAIIYNELITGELTYELCIDAKELRNKLVKVRTHIGRIHKAEKEYYKAGGLFVDAWKNKNTVPIEIMEAKLVEIEKHFENLEKEKLEHIKAKRRFLLDEINITTNIEDALNLPAEIWDTYYEAQVNKHKEAIKAEVKAEKERIKAAKIAEKERVKAEKIQKLHDVRAGLMRPYWNFAEPEKRDGNFGELSKEEWVECLDFAMEESKKHDIKQENIRLENKRLNDKAESDKKKAEKAKEKRKDITIEFLLENGYKEDNSGMSNETYHHFIGSYYYSDFYTDKELELFKSDVLKAKERAKAEAKNKELASRLKAIDDKKASDKKTAEKEAKAKANAPDKEKIKIALNNLFLPNLELDNKEANDIYIEILIKVSLLSEWSLKQIEKL